MSVEDAKLAESVKFDDAKLDDAATPVVDKILVDEKNPQGEAVDNPLAAKVERDVVTGKERLVYMIVPYPLDKKQQVVASAMGIGSIRKPIDKTPLAIVGFYAAPEVFKGAKTYSKEELIKVTSVMPWCNTALLAKFQRMRK